MENECKCGLKFGVPATLRIHQNKCEFMKPVESVDDETAESTKKTWKTKKAE